MHPPSACLLNKHLHPDNRGKVPLCEECWGHDLTKDENDALKKQVAELRNEVTGYDHLIGEIEGYEHLVELQRSRMGKATDLWREAHDRPDVFPDLGELLDWLLMELEGQEGPARALAPTEAQEGPTPTRTQASQGSIETIVEAGLKAAAEQDKIPPTQRFDRLVQAGIIDQRGRVLHLDDAGDGEMISIRELRARLEALSPQGQEGPVGEPQAPTEAQEGPTQATAVTKPPKATGPS